MAQRRVAGAVGEGIGVGLSSLGQQLREMAQLRQQEQLIRERQVLDDERAQRKSLIDKALADPMFARRLPPTLQKQLGLEGFGPSGEDIQQAVSTDISTADKPEKLPTIQDILARVRERGGIVSDTPVQGFTQITPTQLAGSVSPSGDVGGGMIGQLKAKQQQFEDQPLDVEYMGPEGVQIKERTTVGGAQGMAQPTERTSAQAAQRAGAEQSARSNAAAAVEWSPQVMAKKIKLAQEQANIQLAQQMKADSMKENNAVSNSLIMLQPRIAELTRLSRKINTAPAGVLGIPGRIGSKTGAYLGTETDAAQLDSLADSLALGMANSIGGNKGQVSENDKEAMLALLPTSSDSKERAGAKLDQLATFFELVPQVLSQLDPMSSPQVRIQLASKALEGYNNAAGKAGGAKPDLLELFRNERRAR